MLMLSLYFQLFCANFYSPYQDCQKAVTGHMRILLEQIMLETPTCIFLQTKKYLQPTCFFLRISQFSRHIKVDETYFFVPQKGINFSDPSTKFAIGKGKVELY